MKPTRTITRIVALVLALTLLLAIPVASAATLVNKTITVKTGVEIYIDGIRMEPTDANGNPVETFIYNGTTYVPLRAVSQSLGETVDWDGQNQRVYIGDVPGSHHWLLDVCPPYQKSGYATPTTFKLAGETYANGFTLKNHGGYAVFNLDGEYDTLDFDLGYVEGDLEPCNVSIYLDDDLVINIEMDADDLPQHYSVPLYGALQMKILNESYGNTGVYGFANVEVN